MSAPKTKTKSKRTKKTGKPTGKKVTKKKVNGRQTVTQSTKTAKTKTKKKVINFGNNDVIQLADKKNPRRPDTKERERFSLFKNGQTVKKNLAAQKVKGFRRRRAAIRKAAERGEITISAA